MGDDVVRVTVAPTAWKGHNANNGVPRRELAAEISWNRSDADHPPSLLLAHEQLSAPALGPERRRTGDEEEMARRVDAV